MINEIFPSFKEFTEIGNYNQLIFKVLYNSFRLICKIESVSIKDLDLNYQKLGFILDRQIVYQFPSIRVRKFKLA